MPGQQTLNKDDKKFLDEINKTYLRIAGGLPEEDQPFVLDAWFLYGDMQRSLEKKGRAHY